MKKPYHYGKRLWSTRTSAHGTVEQFVELGEHVAAMPKSWDITLQYQSINSLIVVTAHYEVHSDPGVNRYMYVWRGAGIAEEDITVHASRFRLLYCSKHPDGHCHTKEHRDGLCGCWTVPVL